MGCSLYCSQKFSQGVNFEELNLEIEQGNTNIASGELLEKPQEQNFKRCSQVSQSQTALRSQLGCSQQILLKIEEDNIQEKDETQDTLQLLYKTEKQFIYTIPNPYNENDSVEVFVYKQVSEIETYNGQLMNDKKQGYGLQIIKNELIFDGYWNQDNWAEGTLFFSTGDILKGYFIEKKLEGQGELMKKNTEYSFKGNFLNGKPDGYGFEQIKYIETFQGQFKNGLRDGNGVCVQYNGNSYWGDWKAGIKEGKGRMIWNDGITYDGEWKNDTQDGEGSMTWPDGRTYVGHWDNGQINGKGLMKWPNKQKYEGNFANGLKEGDGTYWWPNGIKYEGQFKAGLQHGYGFIIQGGLKSRFKFKDGKRYLDGKRVSKIVNEDLQNIEIAQQKSKKDE